MVSTGSRNLSRTLEKEWGTRSRDTVSTGSRNLVRRPRCAIFERGRLSLEVEHRPARSQKTPANFANIAPNLPNAGTSVTRWRTRYNDEQHSGHAATCVDAAHFGSGKSTLISANSPRRGVTRGMKSTGFRARWSHEINQSKL